MKIVVEPGVVAHSRKSGYNLVVTLDWEDKVATVAARHKTEGTQFRTYYGHQTVVRISPKVKAPVSKVRAFLREHADDVAKIENAYQRHWNGNNVVAIFPGAREELESIESSLELLVYDEDIYG